MIVSYGIISAPMKSLPLFTGTSQPQSLEEIRVMPIYDSKFCSACKIVKPSSDFYAKCGRPSGNCKECTKQKRREEYAKDPEKVNKKNLESHYRNREKRLAEKAEYRKKNKEKLAAQQARWYQLNKHIRGSIRKESKEDTANYYNNIIANKNDWKSKFCSKDTELTQEILKEILSYDKETGYFYWNVSKGSAAIQGDKAGFVRDGYAKIKINGKEFFAHRLAWLYVHGRLPINEIDHKNGNGSDNRFINLREATRYQNVQNLHKVKSNNKLGVTGVYKKGNKYIASIKIDNKRREIGYFNSIEEAKDAYLKVKREKHPFFTG
jgi:HNH endonuclease